MKFEMRRADELKSGDEVVTAEDGRTYTVASVRVMGAQIQIRYSDGLVEHAPPAAPYDVGVPS